MKPLVILFILCVCPIYSQTYYMNVRMKGGGTTTIQIRDIQKLTFSGITDVKDEKWATVIKTFTLLQNYPNPFNPNTTIKYQLPKSGNVEVRIFNVAGQLVTMLESDFKTQGEYKIVWDGRNNAGQVVASGLYFYQVAFENSVLVKKMLFIK